MSLVYLTHRVWYCTESTQQAATIWSLEDRLYPSYFTPVWIRWGLDSSSIGVKVKLSVTVIYLQYWGVPIHGLSVLNADCLRQRELHNSVNSSPLVPSDPGWWVSEIVHWSMWTHCRHPETQWHTAPSYVEGQTAQTQYACIFVQDICHIVIKRHGYLS